MNFITNVLRRIALWPITFAVLILILPILYWGPWVPLCDLIGFVGINSYPSKLSYGPYHYYIFEFTYLVPLILSRLFVDFGLSCATQVSIFYLGQALIFFVVIWQALELLVPFVFYRRMVLILGTLAFWDGLSLWGGPLAYSMGSVLLMPVMLFSLREAAHPESRPLWPLTLLTLAAAASHPFPIIFAFAIFAARALLLPRSRVHSLVMFVVLFIYQRVLHLENPENDFGNLLFQLFQFYPGDFYDRVLDLFFWNRDTVARIMDISPFGLSFYFVFLGWVHLAGFVCSPILAVMPRVSPGIKMLAVLNTIVLIFYFFAQVNTVISMWPYRILSAHTCTTYLAGVILPWYLLQRGQVVNITDSNWTGPAVLRPILFSVLIMAMLIVETPVLRLGQNIGENYDSLRSQVLATGLHDSLLIANEDKVQPWYLKCLPNLIFSDPRIIQRNLLVCTVWHHQGRVPTRIAELELKPIRPHYYADFTSENGVVTVHLTPTP